jgi:hypothetical protein
MKICIAEKSLISHLFKYLYNFNSCHKWKIQDSKERYIWIIVESGVKQHSPSPPKIQQILFIQLRHQVQHEQPNIYTEIQTHIYMQYTH